MHITSVALAFVFIGCMPPPAARGPSSTTGDGLLVTTDTHCPADHHCDILEIVDLHTDADSEDKGFDVLRARARAEGADAVIGAEFEHGEGKEPSHLSGMVIRYGEGIPEHEVLGVIDIPSDPESTDKGMAAMSQKRAEMGGDRVIDVTFEHGEDGKQGHLRGTVIRYTRSQP